jgi:hypothetical protein
MSSLYRTLKRYADRKQELDSACSSNSTCTFAEDFEDQYHTGLDGMDEVILKKMSRSYRNNMVVREAVNGKRSVKETAEEYTMHDDNILPGTTAVGRKMRRMNRYLRGATGIWDSLDAPFLGSNERKIRRIRGRAAMVDEYIDAFAGRIIERNGRLPNSDKLPEKKTVMGFINRQVDYVLDMCCRD